MKTIYLKSNWSINAGRGLEGELLAKHLKDDAGVDGFRMAHAVWPDDEANDVAPEMVGDILTESDVRRFRPDLVYLEGGLGRSTGPLKLGLGLAKELAEQGTTVVVADVDRTAAEQQEDVYKSAASLLGCVPWYGLDGRTLRYGHDKVSFANSPFQVKCHPDRMWVDEELRPIYDGVEVVVAGSPVLLEPLTGSVLATGNSDTSDVLELDNFVDQGRPFCWACCQTFGEGFVVTLGANVSSNFLVRNYPDNARWISKIASHLHDSTIRYRELTPSTPPPPAELDLASVEELLAVLRQGEEDRRVEAKETARWDTKQEKKNPALEEVVLKAIAGFANAEGGDLLIGVEDRTGTIRGLDRDYRTLGRDQDWDGFLNWLTGLVGRRLDITTAERVRVRREIVEGQEIAVIQVPPSRNEVWLDRSQFWLRVQNSTRQLSGSDLSAYLRHRFR